MEALIEELVVGARGPQQDTGFILSKTGQRPLAGQQLCAVYLQQPIHGDKACDHLFHVIESTGLDAIQAGPIGLAGQLDALTDIAHCVGPGAGWLRHTVR